MTPGSSSPPPRGRAQWRRVAVPRAVALDLPLHPGTGAELAQIRRAAFGAAQLVTPEPSDPDPGAVLYPLPPSARPIDELREPALETVRGIVTGAADAVGTLHDRGLAHGALGPELVFEHGGSALVLGYGARELARAAAVEAPSSVWSAPELASDGAASERGDVYALGRLAQSLLAGRDAGQLSAVVARALATNPRERQPDAQAFAREVRRANLTPANTEPTRVEVPTAAALPRQPQGVAPPPAPTAEPTRASEPKTAAPEAGPVSRRDRNNLLAILFSVGGGLLLVFGFAGLFAYAWWSRSALPPAPSGVVVTPAPPVVPTATTPPAPSPSPPPAPPPTASAEPPEEDPTPVPEPPPDAVRPPPLALGGEESPLPVTSAQPVFGPSDAPVTLMVFGDLECPHTRRSVEVLDKLLRAFPTELRIVWRHRPLPAHSNAQDAAVLAQALFRSAGSEAFLRLLRSLANETAPPRRDVMNRILQGQRRSEAQIEAFRQDGAARKEVALDLRLAGQLGVRATPTFYLNGARIEGAHEFRELQAQVQQEARRVSGLLATGMAKRDVYAARVRKNLIGIGNDPTPRTCPEVDAAPTRGPHDALVTLVVFSEFQCAFCKNLHRTLETVLARRGGNVRMVWKNFPLPHHAHARPAAALALEARRQGGNKAFWNVHDLLFENQKKLGDASLWGDIAGRARLDVEGTLAAMQRGDHTARITADIREGDALDVKGTPTLFINGRRLAGARPVDELTRVVDEEVDWAQRMLKSGAPRHGIYAAVCGDL